MPVVPWWPTGYQERSLENMEAKMGAMTEEQTATDFLEHRPSINSFIQNLTLMYYTGLIFFYGTVVQ
jgi:hypothetical protein